MSKHVKLTFSKRLSLACSRAVVKFIGTRASNVQRCGEYSRPADKRQLVFVVAVLVAHGVACAQTPEKSLYNQIVEHPEAGNGFEDILHAADIVNDGCGDIYYNWTPGTPPPQTYGDLSDDTKARRVRTMEQLAGLDYLGREKAMLDHYAAALDWIRKGNLKQASYYPKRPIGLFDRVPRATSAFFTLIRLEAADAYVKFATGDSKAGVSALMDGLTLSMRLRVKYGLFYLVGCYGTGVIFAEAENLVGHCGDSDDARFANFVDATLAQPDPIRGIVRDELEYTLATLPQISQPAKNYVGGESKAFDSFEALIEKATPAERMRLQQQIADSLNVKYADLLARLSGPESQWFAKRAVEDFEGTPVNSLDDGVRLIVSLRSPHDMSEQALVDRIKWRLLGLRCRIDSYRWHNGHLPGALGDAVPQSLIRDPASGSDFVYELKEGGSYRIYSKGLPSTGAIDLQYQRVPGMPGNSVPPPQLNE